MSFLNPFAPPNFSGNAHLTDELRWTDTYIPTPGTPDQFILDSARDKYKELAESYSALDGKADRMLHVSGVFIGILAAGFLGLKVQPSWSATPSFACMLVAMLFCIVTQLPHYKPSPPTIHSLLDGFEENKDAQDRVQLWVAIGFHKATEELRVACDWKANRLIWAAGFFTAGAFFLTLIPAVSAL